MLKRCRMMTILGVIVMAGMVTLDSCGKSRTEYVQQALELLEEKYGRQFEESEYLGADWKKGYYGMLAYEKGNPDLLFELKAAEDGSWISDEFVASCVADKIRETLMQDLAGIPGYYQIKVEAAAKSIDSNDFEMSPEQFLEMKQGDRFAVYLAYAPQEKDAGKVYGTISNAFQKLDYLNGNLQFYITQEETLAKVQEYLEANAKIDYGFEKLLEDAGHIEIPVEDGKLQMEQGEFENLAGGAL